MKLSNSKLDVYKLCGHKYKLSYVDGWEADKTQSSLLFGKAIDDGLNCLLEAKRDGKELDVPEARRLFLESMSRWKGDTLEYFKNEMPDNLTDEELKDPATVQLKVWEHLVNLGYEMIDIYHNEVMPLFKSVYKVQEAFNIENEAGDTFQLVIDALVEMQDGSVVLIDNKTSSKKYPKNSVIKSQQLALYTDYFSNDKCGYIVLLKKPHPASGEKWHMLLDVIPEGRIESAFEDLENALEGIKAENFEKNFKSCYEFGRPCQFMALCKRGTEEGLRKRVRYKG